MILKFIIIIIIIIIGIITIVARMDSVVAILTRLQAGHPKNCDWIPGNGKRFFSTLNCPASLIFNGYRRLISGGKG
jgi:hypothetical protein